MLLKPASLDRVMEILKSKLSPEEYSKIESADFNELFFTENPVALSAPASDEELAIVLARSIGTLAYPSTSTISLQAQPAVSTVGIGSRIKSKDFGQNNPC